MQHFYSLALLGLIVLLPLYLYRALKGPGLFDRLIGLNGIATKAVLLLILVGLVDGHVEMYIDIGIGYGLLNVVGALALGKYLENRENAK